MQTLQWILIIVNSLTCFGLVYKILNLNDKLKGLKDGLKDDLNYVKQTSSQLNSKVIMLDFIQRVPMPKIGDVIDGKKVVKVEINFSYNYINGYGGEEYSYKVTLFDCNTNESVTKEIK